MRDREDSLISVDTRTPARWEWDHAAGKKRPSKVLYGWYIVFACSAIAFVTWGVAFYNLGVFLHSLHEQHGWSTTVLSGGVSVFYLVAGVTGFVAGQVLDRKGPRVLLAFGGLTMGGGIMGLGRATHLWQVYTFDALLAIGFGCSHTLVLGAVITRWFQKRRALAMTLALSGGSIGGLVLVPVSTAVIVRSNLATAGTMLAVVAWGITIPAALAVVRDRPTDKGLLPDGNGAPRLNGTAYSDTQWTLKGAMRTWQWWSPTLAFMLALVGQIGFLVHQVSFLDPLLGTSGAAGAVGLTTVTSLIGRVALGSFGDRIPPRTAAILCMATQGVAIAITAFARQPIVLILACALFGLTAGNMIALQPLLMADRFGLHAYGAIYGPAYFLTQIGSATGPLLVGVLADRTGGYTAPFGVATVAAGTAMLLLLVGGSSLHADHSAHLTTPSVSPRPSS